MWTESLDSGSCRDKENASVTHSSWSLSLRGYSRMWTVFWTSILDLRKNRTVPEDSKGCGDTDEFFLVCLMVQFSWILQSNMYK